jgi:hypothetical protein
VFAGRQDEAADDGAGDENRAAAPKGDGVAVDRGIGASQPAAGHRGRGERVEQCDAD